MSGSSVLPDSSGAATSGAVSAVGSVSSCAKADGEMTPEAMTAVAVAAATKRVRRMCIPLIKEVELFNP